MDKNKFRRDILYLKNTKKRNAINNTKRKEYLADSYVIDFKLSIKKRNDM
jgi:hypothetical protein